MYNIVRYYFTVDRTIELFAIYIYQFHLLYFSYRFSEISDVSFAEFPARYFFATHFAFLHFSRLPVNSHVYFRNRGMPDTLGRKTGGCLPSKEPSRILEPCGRCRRKDFPDRGKKAEEKRKNIQPETGVLNDVCGDPVCSFFYDRRSVKSRRDITKICDGGFARRRHKFPGVYGIRNTQPPRCRGCCANVKVRG